MCIFLKVVLMTTSTVLAQYHDWQNNYGENHVHNCVGSDILTSVHSQYSYTWNNQVCQVGPLRDRIWEWRCDDSIVSLGVDEFASCQWLSNGVNQYKGILNSTCGEDRVLTGVRSNFSCIHDDRIFELRCCSVKELGYKTVNCTYTSEYINVLGGGITYDSFDNTGHVFVGLFSTYHDDFIHLYNSFTNHYIHVEANDRRWKIYHCALVKNATTVPATTSTDKNTLMSSTIQSHDTITDPVSISIIKATTKENLESYVSSSTNSTTKFTIKNLTITTAVITISDIDGLGSSTISLVSTNALNNGASSVIASSISVLIVLLLTLVAIVIVGLIIFIRRKQAKAVTIHEFHLQTSGTSLNGENLTNTTYQVTTQTENFYAAVSQRPEQGLVVTNNLPASTEALHYSVVCNNYELAEEFQSNKDEHQVYSTLQFGLCVPNKVQRQQLETDEESIYKQLNDMYCTQPSQGQFFIENSTYWNPEDSTDGIYEQLAQRRYREIPRHEIKMTSRLGTGQFGSVDKGVWCIPNRSIDVAIKTLKGSATEDEELKFLQEAAINGQFHHPNVVQLCGVVTVGQPVMIVMEYIAHGDLKSFLESKRAVPGELPDDSLPALLFKFSHQIACGMAYLSGKKFIHRDLAARNILVSKGKICKIADFGMSRNLQDETYYSSHSKKIPVKWTAPEAIHYRKYAIQSDVWSFGSVLYEIWSVGHKPFEKCTNQECYRLIESGYRLPSPPGCPRAVYEIMINCWHPVAADRPSFSDLRSLLANSQSLLSPSDHPLSNLGVSVLYDDDDDDDDDSELLLYSELQNKYKV